MKRKTGLARTSRTPSNSIAKRFSIFIPEPSSGNIGLTEDHLGVGSDDVATVSKTPCDGVEHPEESEHGSGDEVDLVVLGRDSLGVGTSRANEDEGDVEEGDSATDEVPGGNIQIS